MASQPGLSVLRRAKFARRLPAALSELVGPTHGSVSLPLRLAWSGLTTFDLDRPRLRMSYYRIVLAEGQYDDLVQYLDRGLLVGLWPTLRTLISRDVREVWESAFDELSDSARAAACTSTADSPGI
ncbi:transcriptional regulator [Streptomyces sp. NPDC058411]|uniref:transcriptional regulator n=1 Tax=Streptomyces sp. NPDC058411 TaxID=3346485 RepID=UPI00365523DF